MRIAGGAAPVSFRCPSGVPVRLTVIGGGTGLVFGDQSFDMVGRQAMLVGPGYEESAGRYDILVTGGADALTVEGW
ncbi:hypothetical protein ACQPYK_01300 [Streptosporangium sp. CA-135522]|uniref:hypothetical protein n=1 Tax=Streptosporangium sp. CA-135522 TaxID=3240072 RepID=UPI003D92488D